MVEIVSYISDELCNAPTAEKLAHELIEAIERLVEFPYLSTIHFTTKPLRNEYRKLTVHNYIVFYWVDEADKLITIARVIYARRDYEKLL